MKRLRNFVIALLVGCCLPLLLWVGAGWALYQNRKQADRLKHAFQDIACTIDSDCPPGFACVAGRCVLAK